MTAQRLITFAGLFLIAWVAIILLMICGHHLVKLYVANTGDDGYSPEHYDHERAEADAARDSLQPYYDDRPTRAEAEADEREDEARADHDRHRLVFYPNSHRYKLDGQWADGVTTLIKGGLPAPALMYWSAKAVAEYVADQREQVQRLYDMGRGPMVAALKEVPWQARDDAANKGTEVHSYAERIVGGEEVDVPESLVGHVESCLAFFEEYKIEPVLVEAAVGSREHGYAGTLDLIANGVVPKVGAVNAIWDYKTSKSGIWPETAFQLAAYAFAEFHGQGGDEQPMPAVDAAYGVHIRADGYDVHPLEFGPHVFAEFLAIAEVARIARRAKGDRQTLGYVGLALQPEGITT